MSRYTREHLAQYTLIGMTDTFGNAWHYAEGDTNHYPDAIPVEEVIRRLFNWRVVEGTLTATFETPDGPVTIPVESHKVTGRSDSLDVLGVVGAERPSHDFTDWLLAGASEVGLGIGSAQTLDGGKTAFVQYVMPTPVETAGGQHKVWLGAWMSHNATLSPSTRPGATRVVCDNTREAFMGEGGKVFKVKASKHSAKRRGEYVDAMSELAGVADALVAEVEAYTNTKVTDEQWASFLDLSFPTEGKEKRGLTMAQNAQDALRLLYVRDARVAPWAGTAYGVVQAMSTYAQHVAIVRGAGDDGDVSALRAERNAQNWLTGKVGKTDADTLTTLARAGVLLPA